MIRTPHLHALAMRTKAANSCVAIRNHPDTPEDQAIGAMDCASAILALPLEADHAALLAEAVKLPEIAALIEAAKKTHIYLGCAALGSLTRALQPLYAALETP